MTIRINQVIQILEALGNGINPVTGEALPATSCANEPATIRALLNLAREIQPGNYTERRKRTPEETREVNQQLGRPARSHTQWTTDDESRLIQGHENGNSIETLAIEHQRSPLAIAAKLHRLGKLDKSALNVYEKGGNIVRFQAESGQK